VRNRDDAVLVSVDEVSRVDNDAAYLNRNVVLNEMNVGMRNDRGGCEKVKAEGVNFIKRHTRPNPGRNIKGGIVEREASIHASNVQLVCPECGAPTRIGRRVLEDGRKVRVCRKCEGVVDK